MSDPLELDVLLVIEELASGDFLVWPFASPDDAAIGETREAALEKQELYLRECLSKIPADQLARYDPDAAARLHRVEVALQRDDLPERLRIDPPLIFPCAIVPNGDRGAWVVVLDLRHVVWIDDFGGEDPGAVDARVAEEVRRVVGARELDPLAFLQLLRGGDPFELQRLRIPVEREERAGAEVRAAARRRRARERSAAEARALLGKIGNSLTEELRRRRLPPVLHREREINALDALLRGPERLALMLVGPALAGKTAVLQGLVQRWLELPKPERERLPEIVATSGAQLVAGQSGFGQLEQRVQEVMAAAEAIDAVLYFDNLADLFARTSGELGDVSASMRPWLERGRVRVIGEISPELLDHHEKRHVGFFAYLNRLAVEPLDAEQTRQILVARAEHDRRTAPERPTLSLPPSRDAATPLVDLAARYFSYQAFPGKALRFYASLRATQEDQLDESGEPRPIGPNQVYRGFSIHSGIPMFLLREERSLEHARIVEYFRERVIGQREAIDRVAETLCTVKAGLQPGQKPLATFLFLGPTGVGKTEVAKTLARFLFNSSERMTRFDMSEYMDPLAADRLIRGSDRDEGVLTRKVRQQPFCVVLLDEIEKAHPAVFDLLLQVCGEGRLSDARGRTTWFHNAIIIMTSNLGAAHRRPRSGFADPTAEAGEIADTRAAERYYLEQVDTHFRPEFVNRIDRIIPFHPLDPSQIREVAEVSLARIREREGLGERGVDLQVAPATLERLAREGYSDTYGARALRRELEDHLLAPLARCLARLGDESEGARIEIREQGEDDRSLSKGERLLARERDDGLLIEVTTRAGRAGRRTLDALGRVSALRRSAAAALELGPIRELRERLRVLVSELGYGAHKRKGERPSWAHSAELGRLQAEHGRIAGTVERLDELRESIESAEELTIAALYEGEPAGLFLEAAEDAYEQLRLAVVDALLLGDERHAITVHLQEQDRRGALCCYLLPLLEVLDSRGWRATFHVHGDKPKAGEQLDKAGAKWPGERAWGPPRDATWVRRQLERELEDSGEAKARRWRDLIVRLSGRHVGALLHAQRGLFRFDARWLPSPRRDKEGRPAHLRVRFIAWTAELSDEQWASDRLVPPKTARRDELEATSKRAWFREDAQLVGELSPERAGVEPRQFWRRLEHILFTGLVTRAFADEDEAA